MEKIYIVEKLYDLFQNIPFKFKIFLIFLMFFLLLEIDELDSISEIVTVKERVRRDLSANEKSINNGVNINE